MQIGCDPKADSTKNLMEGKRIPTVLEQIKAKGDALALEGRGQGTFLSGLEITYHAECMPGEEIRISRAQRPEGSFVHGEGPAGDARFDIRMELTRQDNGK